MAKLVLHLPDGTTRDFRLDSDRITIGRRADHHIHLPYPAVSADHAEIVTVAADSFLHDLGSTNGTLVNGSRIAKHFLRDRDRIDIGLQQLVYMANEAETVEPLVRPAEDVVASEEETEEDSIPSDPIGESLAEQEGAAAVAHAAEVTAVDQLLRDLQAAPNASTAEVVEERTLVEQVAAEYAASPSPETKLDAQVVVEQAPRLVVLSGPNVGQTTTMTKAEFVMGKAGTGLASIRRDGAGFRLVLLDHGTHAFVNGRAVGGAGALLAFEDVIEVRGVKLRFCDGRPN
jgi:pSer/pThr/pTyr-binding forkhead associated (FHA) protein